MREGPKTMKPNRLAARAALVALTAALGAARPAAADQPAPVAPALDLVPRDEGFIRPPPSVSGRKYSFAGRSDFGVYAALPIPLPLVEHYGAALTYNFNFNEYLALDVMVDGGYGGLTSLARDLRKRNWREEKIRDDLRGSVQLFGVGQLGVRLTPFYGKVNLSSELPVHFRFYVTAGAGAAFVKYESILACAENPTTAGCPNDVFRSTLTPTWAFHGGAGLQFLINQTVSLKFEVRDLVMPDHRYLGTDMRAPKTVPGQPDPNLHLVQQPLVLIGAGFVL